MAKTRKPLFMIHKHHATHLHYDLRIEIGDNLKSWALRELPINSNKAISAIRVPDHPFWYRHFEGVIPEFHYGAGPVMVWDKGLYTNFTRDFDNKIVPIEKALDNGFIQLKFEAYKLNGYFILVRISKKQKWLLIKMSDNSGKFKKTKNWNKSVKSNKTLEQIFKKYTTND